MSKKPRIEKLKRAAQHARQQQEKFNKVREEFREEFRLRRAAWEREREEMDAFRAELEKDCGTVGHPKASLLFEKAWDSGHSGGIHEVRSEYEDLVELIQD